MKKIRAYKVFDENMCCKGFLKKHSYKDAWKISWDSADKKDRLKIKDLPNFNKELFEEISGIDVDED